MAPPPPSPELVSALFFTAIITIWSMNVAIVCGQGATWCVARSDASNDVLQTALDYACGVGGADCFPLQPDQLCFLPNTIQAHASYAFNSFYQRKTRAPGSCDFSGTATIATTDPSMHHSVFALFFALITLFLLCFFFSHSVLCVNAFFFYCLCCVVSISSHFFIIFCGFVTGYGSCVYPSTIRYAHFLHTLF